MFVDDRRINPDNDTRYFMEQVNISPVIAELKQIDIDDMAYAKGDLYNELANILDGKSEVKIDREVIAILNRFKEYSFSMFPDTRYNKYLSEDLNNEDCIKYLVENASDEVKANAKAIVLEQWRNDCNARSENFHAHLNGDGILSDDILIKATSRLHSKIIQFAIMLDCILLENHHDLIQMQEQYGIKLIDSHSKAHLTEYTGMKGYAEKLLGRVVNVEVKDETTIESHKGRPKGKAVDPFIQNIIGDRTEQEKILQKLHAFIDGKKGKYVAMVIHAVHTKGLILKPTFTQVKNEFGDIGNVSGYNRYMRDYYVFTDRELDAIRSQF